MTLPATSNVSSVGARLAGATGLLAVLSLVLQGVALHRGIDGPLAVSALSRFLALFAILAGALVAVTCLLAAVRPEATTFAAHPAVRGAVAAYSAFVMVAYGLLLQAPWIPSDLQVWADVGLDFIVPMLYLTWWTWHVPHGALRALHGIAWTIVPVAMLLPLRVDSMVAAPVLLVGIGGLVLVADRILGATK